MNAGIRMNSGLLFPRGGIGIVGGMGPQAGIALSGLIVSQTEAQQDQDHIPQLLVSDPFSIADRTAFITGKVKTNPGFRMAEIILGMSAQGITHAALACNSAHAPAIFSVIEHALEDAGSGIKMLHIVRETSQMIREFFPDVHAVGILGTTGTFITRQYDAMAGEGLTITNLSDSSQEILHRAIYSKKFGLKSNNSPYSKAGKLVELAADELIEKGAELIVLGCTELPMAFQGRTYKGIALIDASLALARALIRDYAPEKLRPLNF